MRAQYFCLPSFSYEPKRKRANSPFNNSKIWFRYARHHGPLSQPRCIPHVLAWRQGVCNTICNYPEQSPKPHFAKRHMHMEGSGWCKPMTSCVVPRAPECAYLFEVRFAVFARLQVLTAEHESQNTKNWINFQWCHALNLG
jgi:hypothetical protein